MTKNDHHQIESPEMLSLMGYSIASEAGQIKKGIEMCLKAISVDSHNSDHFLHLGRIYLLAKKKQLAIRTFRLGLRAGKNAKILEELRLLGTRQSPPFTSLPRNHVVNRFAGKILNTLRLR